MSRPRLVLLDACGVILNDPLPGVLAALAESAGQPLATVLRRYGELRVPFWTGRVDAATFWRGLTMTGAEDDAAWGGRLASSFAPGPAAPMLAAWAGRARLRVLSNHRSDWLLTRLADFGLAPHFERIVVSDAIGRAKPDPEAFVLALDDAGVARHEVLFVDDKRVNVEAAQALGMEALLAEPGTDWVAGVSARVGLG